MGSRPKLTRWKTITIAVVIILLLSLMALTGKERIRITFLENAVLTMVSPAQNAVSTLTSKAEETVDLLRNYRSLEKENKQLRQQLAEQETIQAQLTELRKENYRLRELLVFEKKTNYEMLPAEVTARNPSQWFEMVTINKGTRQGVEQGMSVVTNAGLVGSIYTTSLNSSQVLLLTDPRRGVSAMVQRSRDPGVVGVVEGSPEHQGQLVLKNLAQEVNIQPGDTIISSGVGPLFPKGLVLGRVLEVGDDKFGLLKYALLETAVDFDRLEEVFVVLEVPVAEEPEINEDSEDIDDDEIEEEEGEEEE